MSIESAPGEWWRIYATRDDDGSLSTHRCLGSHRIPAAAIDLPVPGAPVPSCANLAWIFGLLFAVLVIPIGVVARRRRRSQLQVDAQPAG